MTAKKPKRASAPQEKHPWSTAHADPTPYGRALAADVARALHAGRTVLYTHRDYCGLGLIYADGAYQYVIVGDGYPQHTVQRFVAEKDFVAWLAAQSDDSLHGHGESDFDRGNQRVTRARLVELIRG